MCLLLHLLCVCLGRITRSNSNGAAATTAVVDSKGNDSEGTDSDRDNQNKVQSRGRTSKTVVPTSKEHSITDPISLDNTIRCEAGRYLVADICKVGAAWLMMCAEKKVASGGENLLQRWTWKEFQKVINLGVKSGAKTSAGFKTKVDQLRSYIKRTGVAVHVRTVRCQQKYPFTGVRTNQHNNATLDSLGVEAWCVEVADKAYDCVAFIKQLFAHKLPGDCNCRSLQGRDSHDDTPSSRDHSTSSRGSTNSLASYHSRSGWVDSAPSVSQTEMVAVYSQAFVEMTTSWASSNPPLSAMDRLKQFNKEFGPTFGPMVASGQIRLDISEESKYQVSDVRVGSISSSIVTAPVVPVNGVLALIGDSSPAKRSARKRTIAIVDEDVPVLSSTSLSTSSSTSLSTASTTPSTTASTSSTAHPKKVVRRKGKANKVNEVVEASATIAIVSEHGPETKGEIKHDQAHEEPEDQPVVHHDEDHDSDLTQTQGTLPASAVTGTTNEEPVIDEAVDQAKLARQLMKGVTIEKPKKSMKKDKSVSAVTVADTAAVEGAGISTEAKTAGKKSRKAREAREAQVAESARLEAEAIKPVKEKKRSKKDKVEKKVKKSKASSAAAAVTE